MDLPLFYYQQKLAQNNEPAIEPAMEVTISPFPSSDTNEKPLDINSRQQQLQASRVQPFSTSLKQPSQYVFSFCPFLHTCFLIINSNLKLITTALFDILYYI